MKTSRHVNQRKQSTLSITNKPIFKIPINLPKHVSSSSSILSPSIPSSTMSTEIQTIASTMKLRTKAALSSMVWKGENQDLLSSIVSTSTTTTTSSSKSTVDHDLPIKFSRPILKNLTLLKQYLSFVQEETGVIMNISSSSVKEPSCLPSLSFQHQPHSLASSGASMIESMVHHSMSKMEISLQNDVTPLPSSITIASSSSGHQRKQTRPLKSISNLNNIKSDEEKQLKKSERLRLKQQRKPRWTSLTTTINKNSKKDTAVIQCICATPHEEFGAMVQCDDCTCWLHLECLALDEHALDETFRCPSCYITLGPSHHLTSAVTWRFAAQWKSERLAARRGNDTRSSYHHRRHTSFGSSQRPIYSQKQRKHHRLYSEKQRRRYTLPTQDESSSSSSDDDDMNDQQQTWMIPKMTIHSSINTTMTTPSGNVLVQTLSNNTMDRPSDISNDMDVDSDTTESDWEVNYRYGQQRLDVSSINTSPSLVLSASSDMDSPSEASTPDEHFGHDDSYVHVMDTTDSEVMMLSTTATSACLDQESLLWLSRLAYLESLQSNSGQQCFTPHASDVFLCDELQHFKQVGTMTDQENKNSSCVPLLSPTLSTTTISTTPGMATPRSDPPSTICSHDLSQFSFDAGPFWSPIQ
ncbi:uncharacterized protein BX664DRAFT_387488 [Halteromyces radiatus]|uniref:uncharacterized protein n=1 Tax=Halteromyces radiatus TaxID=101107 RepID=UPI00221F426A|nr:uncharacterized protein BX664DRAFT_387488 [Halteromyces radiatus]KAI8084804.1 hypothetical protein BX664DRAFT_387488 [Halteromyces radiatus]